MADKKKSKSPEDQEQGYTPASPVKRTLAWIGLAYALILLALTTYFFYTGTTLGNLGPLLAFPGLVGLGILTLVSWRTTGTPRTSVAIVVALACFALAAFTLPLGIVGLLSNFRR
ncbi:MAG: hypothetical protein ACOX7N_01350 [Lawsonibacter sp.]|jgi:hypothetical protein